jgi:hypothetical protein
MATTHSNQIKLYNNKFNEEENTHHTYTGKYYNQHINLKNTSVFIRYRIKLEIDFEVEQHRREGLIFDWKGNTYDNINKYFENN